MGRGPVGPDRASWAAEPQVPDQGLGLGHDRGKCCVLTTGSPGHFSSKPGPGLKTSKMHGETKERQTL